MYLSACSQSTPLRIIAVHTDSQTLCQLLGSQFGLQLLKDVGKHINTDVHSVIWQALEPK